jgi:hypothetical protein
LACSGPFLAYLVNEKKVRVFNSETGQKCSFDRAQGIIVGLAWSDDSGQIGGTYLGILAEDGEITLGRIVSDILEEGDSGIAFEVTSILSFPEIGRARSICWNQGSEIGGKKHLAVYGSASSDVFFVHCSNSISCKSSFINASIQDIKNVSMMENGACWVVGSDGSAEKFQYSGSSFQSSLSLKLPLNDINSVKIAEIAGLTYFIVVCNSVLSVFASNTSGEAPIRVSSMDLNFNAKESIFDTNTQTLALFSNGQQEIQIISLSKFSSPQNVPHSFNPASSIVLDAIFDSNNCKKECNTTTCSVIFYYSDSICRHDTSFDLENFDFESEGISSEAEFSENEERMNNFQENVSPNVCEESTQSSSLISPIDLNTLKLDIKAYIREAVRESLSEVVHEALNSSIKAGFEQISDKLLSLTRNLINSVDGSMEDQFTEEFTLTSLSEPCDANQAVRNLISKGQLGNALRKCASDGNSRMILEVCQKFEDPFTALDDEQLSQETLIQMFGLLSVNIDEDTEIKLDWLQEILIQIDFDSEAIEMPQLSSQVDALFGDLKSLVNDSLVDVNLQKKMKTVMRLLRKFQMN